MAIKTLQFGEKEVSFNSALAWTFIYKSQFKKDAITYLLPLFTGTKGEDVTSKLMSELGFTGTVEIAWSMAKLVDNSIPDPVTWLASFEDDFPFVDVFEELVPMIVDSCLASKNLKAPSQKKASKGQKKQ